MNHILVVEDENWLAMELAWLVQEAGYAVLGPERSVAEAQKAVGPGEDRPGVARHSPRQRERCSP
jgi:DNA-binding response OmpR family regulator